MQLSGYLNANTTSTVLIYRRLVQRNPVDFFQVSIPTLLEKRLAADHDEVAACPEECHSHTRLVAQKTYTIARDQIQDDHIALLGLGSIDNVYKGYVFRSALEVPTKQ